MFSSESIKFKKNDVNLQNSLSFRVGHHPQDRKKKIIKEWSKTTSANSNGGTPNPAEASAAATAAAAAAAARGFVDFGYDGNPIHYPYAYPDVSLVHSWHHHSSLHHQHQHQMAPPGISYFYFECEASKF